MLLGLRGPGGRLPTAWPKEESDVPIGTVIPVDGAVRYDEGIHIGYRAWLKAGTEPAYPFGHGLGYTTWALSDVGCETQENRGDVIDVIATVANTGSRAGKQVVQVYAVRADSAVDRPVRWLVGFASAWVEASQSAVVRIPVPVRAFANWDDGWRYEQGTYDLRVGTSVIDLPHIVSVELNSERAAAGATDEPGVCLAPSARADTVAV